MAYELRNSVRKLEEELQAHPAITLQKMTVGLPLNKRQKEDVKSVKPQSAFALHQELNELEIAWEPKDAGDPDVQGDAHILPVKEVLKDWPGVVYFDFTPADARIRFFHPVDFFVDEACVGAFLNEADREDPAMYLYRFEGDATPLDLNMEGYVKMLLASKGFLYWQYAILEIINQKENPMSRRFKEWMPRLFSGFDWKQYVEQYGKLRLSGA
jgi:hypothetical protein